MLPQSSSTISMAQTADAMAQTAESLKDHQLQTRLSRPRLIRLLPLGVTTLIMLFLGFGAGILSPTQAIAECRCQTVPLPLDALQLSTTAFIGRVVSIRTSPVKEGFNEIKFSIMQRLKGFQELMQVDELLVFTPIAIDNCGYQFAKDNDYIVFTQGNPAGLRTTSCLGTVYLDSARPHLDALLKSAERPSTTR